ncbi:MAG TPA: sporulation protein YunB [Clostridiaceae bacterium]|jgi:sporulation protein YunB|nr:sporulation protein YunB [Clostridiaceae bacterium]
MLPSRKRKIRLIIYLLLILFIIIFVFIKIDRDVKPVLFSVSNAEARILATESINRIVKEELSKNVKYSDFVEIKTDSNGDISAIEMNTIEMNKFGTAVALKVQEEMKFLGGRGIGIPVGVLTKSALLSYMGPVIHVKVLPYGNVSTDFRSELESAGINQSRYRVYIVVNVNLQLMIPFGEEKMNVSSGIPIAETLIVGKVPSSYFNTGSGGFGVPYAVPTPSQ